MPPSMSCCAIVGQIDDGGHSMVQQQITLDALWGRLRPCGAFVVEDLHTSLEPRGSMWRDDGAGVPTTLELLLEGAGSRLVDFRLIMAEAEQMIVYRPSDQHVTAVIFKKCGLQSREGARA